MKKGTLFLVSLLGLGYTSFGILLQPIYWVTGKTITSGEAQSRKVQAAVQEPLSLGHMAWVDHKELEVSEVGKDAT